MKAEKLPKSLKPFFWDVNFNNLDLNKNRTYIVCRVLEKGDFEDIKVVFDEYGKEAIVQVIKKTNNISRKTANFWSLMLDIKKEEIKCLQKPYRKILCQF